MTKNCYVHYKLRKLGMELNQELTYEGSTIYYQQEKLQPPCDPEFEVVEKGKM